MTDSRQLSSDSEGKRAHNQDTDTDTDTDQAQTQTQTNTRNTPLRTWLWILIRDFLAISGWVLLITYLFLSVRWPRWAFYLLLVGGVVLYVRITGR